MEDLSAAFAGGRSLAGLKLPLRSPPGAASACPARWDRAAKSRKAPRSLLPIVPKETLTAVMAVPNPALREKLEGSIGSNGSTSPSRLVGTDAFAGALTRGSIGTIRESFQGGLWLRDLDSNQD
jgi:hypothetical protein